MQNLGGHLGRGRDYPGAQKKESLRDEESMGQVSQKGRTVWANSLLLAQDDWRNDGGHGNDGGD